MVPRTWYQRNGSGKAAFGAPHSQSSSGWFGWLCSWEAFMPCGPSGEGRLADVIGAAVMVAKIATGEVEDTKTDKNPHAAALGRLGGKARARAMTKAQRSDCLADELVGHDE